jgi:hypothetical protein
MFLDEHPFLLPVVGVDDEEDDHVHEEPIGLRLVH